MTVDCSSSSDEDQYPNMLYSTRRSPKGRVNFPSSKPACEILVRVTNRSINQMSQISFLSLFFLCFVCAGTKSQNITEKSVTTACLYVNQICWIFDFVMSLCVCVRAHRDHGWRCSQDSVLRRCFHVSIRYKGGRRETQAFVRMWASGIRL